MVHNLEEYSDIHRSTLQTIMNYGVIEEEKFETIFKIIWAEYNPEHDYLDTHLTTIIEMINERIGRFDQMIVKFQYGLNLTEFYVFYSTAKTSISKLQNSYNEFELELFKHIFTLIIENQELKISPRDALNLQSKVAGKVSKVRTEKLIDLWTAGGYFFRHDNVIFLGPKSLIEFKENLQKMNAVYLRSCMLCEDVAAWGVVCESCKKATFHKKCIQKFLTRTDKCPSCKKKWHEPLEQ